MLGVTAWLALLAVNANAQAQAWAAGQAQLASGNAESAYRELLKLEERFAGPPEFDYLLGLAAFESGLPDAATFAFERVLTVDPTFFWRSTGYGPRIIRTGKPVSGADRV